jgi:crotonobetainyl-CoA:carnitine CoA-transferase CaiB-like acyl-CoA transferase
VPAVGSPLAEAWRTLGAVAAPPLGAANLPALELRGSARFPPSPFALEEIAVASIGAALLAAAELAQARGARKPVPSLEQGHALKRSALLDLRAREDRAALERLLASADVLVQGYRPGALAAFGLDRAQLAARHPHLVTVTLSAWGDRGPWSGRRGFDSLVQAACGIAVACGSSGEPGALPVQALDHATGYLIAAVALRGLSLRARCGRAAHAYLALARTASWIMRHRVVPTVAGARPEDRERYLVEVSSPAGPLRCVAPPGALDGRTLRWPRGVPQPGADPPQWSMAGARQRPRASV